MAPPRRIASGLLAVVILVGALSSCGGDDAKTKARKQLTRWAQSYDRQLDKGGSLPPTLSIPPPPDVKLPSSTDLARQEGIASLRDFAGAVKANETYALVDTRNALCGYFAWYVQRPKQHPVPSTLALQGGLLGEAYGIAAPRGAPPAVTQSIALFRGLLLRSQRKPDANDRTADTAAVCSIGVKGEKNLAP